jgi:hypothetical protein
MSQNLTIEEFSKSDGVVERNVMMPSTIGLVELSTMFLDKAINGIDEYLG